MAASTSRCCDVPVDVEFESTEGRGVYCDLALVLGPVCGGNVGAIAVCGDDRAIVCACADDRLILCAFVLERELALSSSEKFVSSPSRVACVAVSMCSSPHDPDVRRGEDRGRVMCRGKKILVLKPDISGFSAAD